MEISYYNHEINERITIETYDVDQKVYSLRCDKIVEMTVLSVKLSHSKNKFNSTGISDFIEYKVVSETYGEEIVKHADLYSSVDEILNILKTDIDK